MDTTDSRISTSTKLERIAWLSGRDKTKEFRQLMHHFNETSLKECYYELKGNRAVGTDGVTKTKYGEMLEKNLKGLITRMKQMQYRPSAVREALIAKEGNAGVRPLGISNFEDKLIQKQMQKLLEAIYEPTFLECSYGFRPGRGCHNAVKAMRQHIYSNPVKVAIDVDIDRKS